jgi:signal transduction histidine kinase
MYAILEINKDATANLYETYRSKCLPSDLDTFTTLINDTVKNKNGYEIDYYIIPNTNTNTLKYIHEIGELVLNEQGEVIKLKGTIQDITNDKLVNDELIHKNEELIKANTELDRFVYSASHDLRAPLTSMRGLLQLLEMEPSPEEIGEQELLKLMDKTIDKMDKFIDDILDYSINSRSELKYENTDIEGLVNSCWENLKYIDVEIKPKCTVNVATNCDFISDKRRLKIILNNLISNAIKYYDKAKRTHKIDVTLAIDEEKATIVIEDNGVGIDKAHIDKIFDMFHRATKLSTGSGMGLYIVSETIDKLKGSIHVDSDLGKGSKFTVTIPNTI